MMLQNETSMKYVSNTVLYLYMQAKNRNTKNNVLCAKIKRSVAYHSVAFKNYRLLRRFQNAVVGL